MSSVDAELKEAKHHGFGGPQMVAGHDVLFCDNPKKNRSADRPKSDGVLSLK
jgi:hypothetical protein